MSDLSSLDVAISPSEKFREFLTTKGKRLTHERRTIVDEVYSSHEHFDVEEFVTRLTTRKDGSRVSRATIYRTIKYLEEAGLIRKVARTQGREVYEHDYGYPQHGHLICEKCDSLIEFTEESISPILDQIASEHGFRVTGHRLEVYGTCEKCNRTPQKRHPKLGLI